jgi:hypothetical protein
MTSRFEFLDPLDGHLPWWPYPYNSNNILWRARALLRGRTVDEITEIAAEAESLIDSFFDTEKDHAVAQILADKRYDLFEDGENSSSGIRTEAYEQYSISGRDNTTELEALDNALDWMFGPQNLEANDVKEFECLASFAIMRLDDFVKRSGFKFDTKARTFTRKSDKELHPFEYSMAASLLLEAQDAVGRAELRRAKDELSAKYEQKIGNLKKPQNIRAEIMAELLEQEKLRRQEESAARNDSRHEWNRQVKAKVLAWFDEDPTKFLSAEKAAKHFCSLLSDEGIEREQRTVADWIRAHAKEKGLRWRA